MSIFDELAAHAALPFESGRMLPLEVYRSEGVLAAERSEIFASEWTCVGRTADVPNQGDYLTAEIPVGGLDQHSSSHSPVSPDDNSPRRDSSIELAVPPQGGSSIHPPGIDRSSCCEATAANWLPSTTSASIAGPNSSRVAATRRGSLARITPGCSGSMVSWLVAHT